jgi:hypothetical protein
MMAAWEASWELQFPAETVEELLQALVVRDLLHGSSYDIEIQETTQEVALDFIAGDELEDTVYRLLISAEVEGVDDREVVQEITEQILEELLEEAENLVEQRQELGSRPIAELDFRKVPEDEERWDLVIPDWLAPAESEVPFGFRGFVAGGDEAWPGNEVMEAHGRVVVVAHGGRAHVFGIPAPTDAEPEG